MTSPVSDAISASGKSSQSAIAKTLSLNIFIVLLGLAALVYVGTIGALPLVGRDEPRYVEIGREMLQSGDWITPRLGGFTWFEKPILLYWMVAASFGVFGVSEWAARLGPALCGLGSAALVWWMVRPTDEKVARWSALALLCSGGMVAFAHGATFDIVLTCTLTLALSAWWKAHTEPAGSFKFLALFWVGVGLAFLSKGLIAFVLPLGTIGLYASLRRERVKIGFWWGLPLALLASGLWYGPVIWINGAKFVNEFFVQHHFARFVSDKFKHHQPVWYYLEILPLLSLPWTPFVVAELWGMRRAGLREKSSEAALKTFALAWLLVPVAFFSLSGSKLPGYILPALPGTALLAAFAIERWTRPTLRQQWVLGAVALLLGVMLVGTNLKPLIARAENKSARGLFEAADKEGWGNVRVANFGFISRPAQFYAARHLLYGKDGEPLSLTTVAQVQEFTRKEPLLLLVEDKARPLLPGLNLEIIADNGTTSLELVLPQEAHAA